MAAGFDSLLCMNKAVLTLLLSSTLFAQGSFKYPPDLPGARVEAYKTIGDAKLNLYIYEPEGHKASDKAPAIVFFFGGGWTNGSPVQFQNQAKYLAARGMVAITADYRVSSRYPVKVVDCVRDANTAIRWVRQNAKRLGIDPNRIGAGGGSAGGHLAAATSVIPELHEPEEDVKISSKPNATVLFNPALVLAPIAGIGKSIDLKDRTGVDPEVVSPYHHIKKKTAPSIIFHGKADTTVPYITAQAFADKMKAMGNRCDLEGYEGETHGFFNYGRGDNKAYEDTVKKMDAFFVSLGWLKGK
jgi:acetyl esterase